MNSTEIEKFHLSRIPFAIVKGKLVHTIFDKRSHKEWLSQVYGVSDSEYEDTIRGYMKDDCVYFYKSSNFEAINMKDIGIDSLNHIQILGMVYMNSFCMKCYNGLIPEGNETIYKPIKYIGTVDELLKQRYSSYGVV